MNSKHHNQKEIKDPLLNWLLAGIDRAVDVWLSRVWMWAEAACGCLGPSLCRGSCASHPLPPFIAAAKPTRAALHSEGLANMDMLTYRMWVGPSTFRGKMASELSSPLSLDSFMTAGRLKYTEGLNHHLPYKSYQRKSKAEASSTLRIGGYTKRERKKQVDAI